MFALFMNLVYFLVLLAYNPKSDWMSTEFKEKVMELGLVFVKFFLFYYILVSLRTFRIKQKNPEVTSTPLQPVVVAKALQVRHIQNVKSPESQVSSTVQGLKKGSQQSPVSSAVQQVNNGPPSPAVGQIPKATLAVGQIPPQNSPSPAGVPSAPLQPLAVGPSASAPLTIP